jgi:hypothetical protein
MIERTPGLVQYVKTTQCLVDTRESYHAGENQQFSIAEATTKQFSNAAMPYESERIITKPIILFIKTRTISFENTKSGVITQGETGNV